MSGSLVVNTNMSAMYLQRNLSEATDSLTLHMKRLSSGIRINDASDDAAGLGLSEKLQSQIDASDIAKKNTQTGINMMQVADADLSEIAGKLQRMRDLSVQSANGIYSTTERNALQQEFSDLKSEIDRIAQSSSFSDLNLLDTAGLNVVLQVGTNNDPSEDRITITFNKADSSSLGLASSSVNSQTNAQNAIASIDNAIETISSRRADVGATVNRLESAIDRTDSRKAELTAANSTIVDADIASETAAYTKSQILQQTSASLLQQANQMPSLAISLVQ